jgi:hypothetical protein
MGEPLLTFVTWMVELVTSSWEAPTSEPDDPGNDNVDELMLIKPALDVDQDVDEAGRNTTCDFIILSGAL